MPIQGLDHINIDTSRPDDTVAFYTEVLGLEDRPGKRPNFGFPGAWLWSGDTAVVHLNFIDEDRTGSTGPFNHIAFVGSDFDGTCAMLDQREVAYRTSIRDEIGLRQIFVKDPNDISVEINIQSR